MLVLSRKVGEQVVVPQCELTVTILEASPGRVRLGITAPASIAVHRSEVCGRCSTETSECIRETLRSIRILIADSDVFLMASYREQLGAQGATVATAANALACIEKLREFTPDVLVLEPELHWGGGDGVLALMQEEPELRPPFVLLLTRGGNRSLLYRLSPFRVDDFQVKPASARRLMERIDTLRRSQPLLVPVNPRAPLRPAVVPALAR
jgi:carbon storage regulator CsrA